MLFLNDQESCVTSKVALFSWAAKTLRTKTAAQSPAPTIREPGEAHPYLKAVPCQTLILCRAAPTRVHKN